MIEEVTDKDSKIDKINTSELFKNQTILRSKTSVKRFRPRFRSQSPGKGVMKSVTFADAFNKPIKVVIEVRPYKYEKAYLKAVNKVQKQKNIGCSCIVV